MEVRATCQVKHCGGRAKANHADRTFDAEKAKNIKSIKDDKAYVFYAGEFRAVKLGKGKLAEWEKKHYKKMFSPYIENQKGKYLQRRQKKRAENCTIDNYFNDNATCPTRVIYQVGKDGLYQDYGKFQEMVKAHMKYVCEHYQTEDARIMPLDLAYHGYEGAERSLHAHGAYSFEVKDKDGNWVQNTELCLEKLGVDLPYPDKEKGRYNNRKMTLTKMMQEKWYDIIEEIDKSITINRTPAPKPINNSHRAEQCIYEMGEVIDTLQEIQRLIIDLEQSFDKMSQKDRKKHMEELHKAVENSKAKFGSLKEKYVLEEAEVLPVSDLIRETQQELEGWGYDD